VHQTVGQKDKKTGTKKGKGLTGLDRIKKVNVGKKIVKPGKKKLMGDLTV